MLDNFDCLAPGVVRQLLEHLAEAGAVRLVIVEVGRRKQILVGAF